MEWADMNELQRREFIFQEIRDHLSETEHLLRFSVNQCVKTLARDFSMELAKSFGPRLSDLPAIPLYGVWSVHQSFRRHIKSAL